jgi:hypothetical protein
VGYSTARATQLSQWRRNISQLVWSKLTGAGVIRVIDTHDILGPRWDTHASRVDCTHYSLGSTGWYWHVSAVLTAVLNAVETSSNKSSEATRVPTVRPSTSTTISSDVQTTNSHSAFATPATERSSGAVCVSVVTMMDRLAASGRLADWVGGVLLGAIIACCASLVLWCCHHSA